VDFDATELRIERRYRQRRPPPFNVAGIAAGNPAVSNSTSLCRSPAIGRLLHAVVGHSWLTHGFELSTTKFSSGIGRNLGAGKPDQRGIVVYSCGAGTIWSPTPTSTCGGERTLPNRASNQHVNSVAGFIGQDSFHSNRVWKRRQAIRLLLFASARRRRCSGTCL
jgi:hypothetical protein